MRKPRALAARRSHRHRRARQSLRARRVRSRASPSSARSDSNPCTTTASSTRHVLCRPARRTSRAAAFTRAWEDPSIAALIAARGGYGSVQLLPLLDPKVIRRSTKAVHRLQRQHVAADLADAARAASSPFMARCSRGVSPGRGWLRSRHVHALSLPRRTSRRDFAPAGRGRRARRGARDARSAAR